MGDTRLRFTLKVGLLTAAVGAIVWLGWLSSWARRDAGVQVVALDAPAVAPAPAEALPARRTGDGTPVWEASVSHLRESEDPRPVDRYGIGDGPKGRARRIDGTVGHDLSGARRGADREPEPADLD